MTDQAAKEQALREEFEKWWQSPEENLPSDTHGMSSQKLHAWLAWREQAARASSPVAANHASSLPQLWNDAYMAFKGAFDSPMMRRKLDDEFSADARKRLRDFDETLRASPVAIPEGYQLVPKEPNAEMIYRGGEATAGHVDWDGGDTEDDDDAPYRLARAVFAAMVSAAPVPKAGNEPVAELREDGKGGGYVHWLSDKVFEVGTKLYASAPPSPGAAQGMEPVAWIEALSDFQKDYRLYVDGHARMPFSELRNSLAAFMEACAEHRDELLASPPESPAPAREAQLEEALRQLIRGYMILLENGRDRILLLGGQCDSVEVMERGDPYLREARAALSPSSQEHTK
jgi:hypothetical protein